MSCSQFNSETVTIIYYCDSSLELKHQVIKAEKNQSGRVVIPQLFKENKSIIAVCHGDIKILNKMGDRIIAAEYVA